MCLYFNKYSLVLAFYTVCLLFGAFTELNFEYHTNEELENILREFEVSGKEKLKTRLYSIGNSSSLDNPFPLWVLELSAAPENKIGVPNVKLLGNMHGNEAGGREILLHFIEFLINQYGVDKNVTWLMNNTRIHIIPTVNPDGFRAAGNSCNGTVGRTVPTKNVDLNRNFPDFFRRNPGLKQVKEAQAIVNWMQNTKFILSAALHEGAMVANYPYDIGNSDDDPGEHLTPDDDVFKHLARTYSFNHPIMHTKGCASAGKDFKEGITNGADWYQFDGGMGDYNYNFHGCMELTLELSCCKFPPKERLPKLWMDNRKSLLIYCMQANRGVTGRVLDFVTRQPIEAILKIIGRNSYFRNFVKTGEFWRILLPGEYILEAEADGYYTHFQRFIVKDFIKDFPKLTNITIYLYNTSIPTIRTTTSTTTTTTTVTTVTDTEVDSGFITSNITSRNGNDNDIDSTLDTSVNVAELRSECARSSEIDILMILSLISFLVVISNVSV